MFGNITCFRKKFPSSGILNDYYKYLCVLIY